MHARVMWKLPSSLWRERGRRLSVRWITGAELGRRISSSHWWREKRPSRMVYSSDSVENTMARVPESGGSNESKFPKPV
ncbi:uncharacterized protein LOC143259440 isoform X5 [Megalopta genalis]|uniref:uncharacterized protein LOC143259440 isoform X5 n=1 Tax=Megalopta genalis TaxID=115081 RepID=UPI003FD30537